MPESTKTAAAKVDQRRSAAGTDSSVLASTSTPPPSDMTSPPSPPIDVADQPWKANEPSSASRTAPDVRPSPLSTGFQKVRGPAIMLPPLTGQSRAA